MKMSLELKKCQIKKVKTCMLIGKATKILLTTGSIKKILLYKNQLLSTKIKISSKKMKKLPFYLNRKTSKSH